MKIKILGSVSPYCKDKKNCPGYLVSMPNINVLLDCGPGITRNLTMPKDLQSMIIIISHLHKDHYGDLLSIGYASYVYHNLGQLANRIKVYIPNGDIENDADYRFLMNFGSEHFLEFIPYDEKTELKFEDLKISFCINPHPVKTFSTKIVEKNKTFVYSSDTGYKNNTLTKFAKNANLLLCEATFLKNQKRVGNTHLYAYEAALIAKKAAVDRLVLTHFFPEITKEEYQEEAKKIFPETTIAEEGKFLKIGGKYVRKIN